MSTAVTNSTNPFAALASSSSGSGSTGRNMEAGSQDRFLTLLVAQMQNQDPLNPTDNAQITSQMAQINTVTGLDKLNTAIAGLSTQFVQMQTLQGASLVGHDVLVAGNRLSPGSAANKLEGSFEIASAADHVQVEILNGAGRVVDTLPLGTQTSGRHSFEWTKPAGVDGQTFRITATAGATKISTTTLMTDRVEAVSTSGQTLQLQLSRSGTVNYDAVKAFN